MARKLRLFFLLSVALFLCIGLSSRSEGETLITCAAAGDCNIALYRSDSPTRFQQRRIELIPTKDANGQNIPIPATNVVTLRYDGAAFATTCDGTWHDFGPAPGGEIRNRISCTVVADTEIHASLSLYDRNVYNSPYSDCPGYTIDPYLNGTSLSSPFCVDDNHLAAASACKWQKQNLNDSVLTQRGVPLNDWVVYGRTNITDLPLSYSVSPQYPFKNGDQVCIVDLNGDGDISQDEMALCKNTPQGYLCPLAAVQCVATYSDPLCPAGGSLNTVTDKCELATSWQCPLNPNTYSGQAACNAACVLTGTCTGNTAYTCPSGYTLSGSVCVATPTCPLDGTFSSTYNYCYDQDYSATCPPGGYMSENWCYASNPCPSGYTWSREMGCNAEPICLYGGKPTYEEYVGYRCPWGSLPPVCPSGGAYNSVTHRCEASRIASGSTYTCSLSGTSYSTSAACQTNCSRSYACTSLCPSGYNYSPTNHLCEAYPICQSGSYDPNKNKCYKGDNTCPYGPQYTCKVVNNISQCSPNDCQPFDSGSIENDDTTQGANDKQDNGTVDTNGNCLGTIYIFNGKDMRCREAGLQTGFFSCCNGGSIWFGLGRCDGSEEQVWQMRRKGLCHYIGDYCSRKLPLIGCVQKKETRCCFNSKLGRILQEQGRPTLQAFGPTGDWGDPKSPNCRGFTAEEFQMLDFDNIDLSEWYGDIVTQTQGNIENTMQNKVRQFYDKTH